ncbi:5-oxoprolinase subunit PxpA [Alteromonadaceae bacterium BrNp21-10]|nr:5-oxoprolinase subunit PxpA [Alteromonadaceae bacterium BrNp21-10]
MKLNCDLAEGASTDAQVMAYIDQANIACGLHAGDVQIMHATLVAAKQHNVAIGAHPSYADRQHFGRRSMALSEDEIIQLIHSQINTLQGLTQSLELSIDYVKPHGALYNDMMANALVRKAVMAAVNGYDKRLKLMVLANNQTELIQREAEEFGLALYFEAFADRCYQDNGLLVPRTETAAVHDQAATLAQVKQLCEQGRVTTQSGNNLAIRADSLCVHGDNAEAVLVMADIRQLVNTCV